MQTPLFTRKRFNSTQRQSILDAYGRSRCSQREFVAEAGIGLSTLHSWLRKTTAGGPAGPVDFVRLPNPLAESAGPVVYRLEFPRGVALEFRSGFAAGEVEALAQILQRI